MKIAYDTLNDREKGSEHWSTILSVLATLTVVTAIVGVSVFGLSYIESVALCIVPVVVVTACAVLILETPTSQFVIGLLLTGFLLSPVYSAVGHGITYLFSTTLVMLGR